MNTDSGHGRFPKPLRPYEIELVCAEVVEYHTSKRLVRDQATNAVLREEIFNVGFGPAGYHDFCSWCPSSSGFSRVKHRSQERSSMLPALHIFLPSRLI